MSNYVQKQLTWYSHPIPKRMSHTPYTPAPVIMGKAAQDLSPLTKALPSTTLAKSLSNKLWGASYIMGGWWT